MSLQRRNRVRCWKPYSRPNGSRCRRKPWHRQEPERRKQNRRLREASPPKSGELFADPEKEARISKVREGIRQTAAAESRFAGMLTPEEEKLMREIISEYV